MREVSSQSQDRILHEGLCVTAVFPHQLQIDARRVLCSRIYAERGPEPKPVTLRSEGPSPNPETLKHHISLAFRLFAEEHPRTKDKSSYKEEHFMLLGVLLKPIVVIWVPCYITLVYIYIYYTYIRPILRIPIVLAPLIPQGRLEAGRGIRARSDWISE